MSTIECGYPGNPTRLKEKGGGPILVVQIGYPPNQPIQLSALLDTGANVNLIEASLAVSLRLPVVDFDEASSVEGNKPRRVHTSIMSIPSLNVDKEPHRFLAVTNTDPYQVILGREFLEKYTLTYDGRTGSVIISNDPKSPLSREATVARTEPGQDGD